MTTRQATNKNIRLAKIKDYLEANRNYFDVLDFFSMSQELKKFHAVITDTKEIGEVFDAHFA